MTDDLRQRYAEAMSRHHLVDGVTDADDNTLCVCGQWADAEDESWDDHMAEVCAAVRDEEVAALRQRADRAEAAVARVHQLHHGPRTERHGSGCVHCAILWPCPTYRLVVAALDGEETTNG